MNVPTASAPDLMLNIEAPKRPLDRLLSEPKRLHGVPCGCSDRLVSSTWGARSSETSGLTHSREPGATTITRCCSKQYKRQFLTYLSWEVQHVKRAAAKSGACPGAITLWHFFHNKTETGS